MEYVLDHLKNVIVNSERNKMTPYNLAVCFGPVLMSSGKEDGRGGRGSRGATDVRADISRIDSREKSVDCAEKHIELLSCLLEVWPVRRGKVLVCPLPFCGNIFGFLLNAEIICIVF